jgi:hypothetical protein
LTQKSSPKPQKKHYQQKRSDRPLLSWTYQISSKTRGAATTARRVTNHS